MRIAYLHAIRDVYLFGELKVYGRFFAELCLIMTGFDRGQQSNDY